MSNLRWSEVSRTKVRLVEMENVQSHRLDCVACQLPLSDHQVSCMGSRVFLDGTQPDQDDLPKPLSATQGPLETPLLPSECWQVRMIATQVGEIRHGHYDPLATSFEGDSAVSVK